MVVTNMSNGESEVVDFGRWLDEALRRAWVLAIAVAIPGAFLVTWWFPHSPQALGLVAILGIGIGVTIDAVQATKKRRIQQQSELLRAVATAMYSIVERVLKEKLPSSTSSSSLEELRHMEVSLRLSRTLNESLVEELRLVRASLESFSKLTESELRKIQLASGFSGLTVSSYLEQPSEEAVSVDLDTIAKIRLYLESLASELDVSVPVLLKYLSTLSRVTSSFPRSEKPEKTW